MEKKKLITIAALGVTTILTLIAVFTAIKLYQIGKEPTPSDSKTSQQPQEKTPEVYQQDPLSCQLTFTVTEESPPPELCTVNGDITVETSGEDTIITVYAPINYANPGILVTIADYTTCHQNPAEFGSYNWRWTLSSSPYNMIERIDFYVNIPEDEACSSGESCGTWTPDASPSPSESASPSPSESASPSPSESASPSPSSSPSPGTSTPPASPLPGCWDYCTSDSQCSSSLRCIQTNGATRCANPYCPSEQDCVCPAASLTPKGGEPAEDLPVAGTISPTIFLAVGGVLLIILGLLL